jgi:hypothetical protein
MTYTQELEALEQDLEPIEGLGERSICSAEPPGFEVNGMPMSPAEDMQGWYAAWIGDADEWLPILVRDNLCFEDAYVYEIDFDAARADGVEFYWMPWDPDPYVWNKGETPDSIMVLSRANHIPAKYVRLVRKVAFDQIEAAEDPYGQSGYGFDEEGEDYDDNPVKASYTGDRCDGGLNLILNEYLTDQDRAKEVSYRTFARHVDVRSFALGRLGSCGHCTFLRSTFPSGKPAWILQWSGFEHLAATPDVDVAEETEAAMLAELSPNGIPLVWWDDDLAVRALGGHDAMNRYEAVMEQPAAYDHETNTWIMQDIAWLVPQRDLGSVEPNKKGPWEVQRIVMGPAKVRYDEPDRGIFVHRANPVADEDDVRDKLRRYGAFVEWFAQVKDKKTRDGDVDKYAIAATLRITPDRLRYLYKAADVFQDLLVGYEMTPKQRRTLENAARDANRKSIRFKMSDLGRAYKKNLDAYVEYAKVAAEVFVGGKQVTRSACPTAGGFHIINAGGFNDKVMGTVSEVICEASNRLTKAGLESIIYGDVNIVGSITGSARLLAHYQIGTDEVFVRANLRGRTGPAVRTILHELAHRLEFKFFTDEVIRHGRRITHRSLQRLHDRLAERYDEKLREAMVDPANWPKKGEVLNKQWVVTGVSGGGTRYGKVHLHHIDDPNVLARTSLEGYVRNRFPATNVFVTLYAATDPSENFAEMVAEMCLGNLTDEQEKMLMDTINEGLGL